MDEPGYSVHKIRAYLQTSDDQATEYGLIPDTRPPLPPPPWRRRVRAWARARSRPVRLRLAARLADVDRDGLEEMSNL